MDTGTKPPPGGQKVSQSVSLKAKLKREIDELKRNKLRYEGERRQARERKSLEAPKDVGTQNVGVSGNNGEKDRRQEQREALRKQAAALLEKKTVLKQVVQTAIKADQENDTTNQKSKTAKTKSPIKKNKSNTESSSPKKRAASKSPKSPNSAKRAKLGKPNREDTVWSKLNAELKKTNDDLNKELKTLDPNLPFTDADVGGATDRKKRKSLQPTKKKQVRKSRASFPPQPFYGYYGQPGFFPPAMFGPMQAMAGQMQAMAGPMQSMAGPMQAMAGQMHAMAGPMQAMAYQPLPVPSVTGVAVANPNVNKEPIVPEEGAKNETIAEDSKVDSAAASGVAPPQTPVTVDLTGDETVATPSFPPNFPVHGFMGGPQLPFQPYPPGFMMSPQGGLPRAFPGFQQPPFFPHWQPYPGSPKPFPKPKKMRPDGKSSSKKPSSKEPKENVPKKPKTPKEKVPKEKKEKKHKSKDIMPVVRGDSEVSQYKFLVSTKLTSNPLGRKSPFSKTYEKLPEPIILVKRSDETFGVSLSVIVDSDIFFVKVRDSSLLEPTSADMENAAITGEASNVSKPNENQKKWNDSSEENRRPQRIFFCALIVTNVSVQTKRKKELFETTTRKEGDLLETTTPKEGDSAETTASREEDSAETTALKEGDSAETTASKGDSAETTAPNGDSAETTARKEADSTEMTTPKEGDFAETTAENEISQSLGNSFLENGDIILSINGHPTTGLTFKEACELFKTATDVGTDGLTKCPVVVARKKPTPDPPQKIDAPAEKIAEYRVTTESVVDRTTNSNESKVASGVAVVPNPKNNESDQIPQPAALPTKKSGESTASAKEWLWNRDDYIALTTSVVKACTTMSRTALGGFLNDADIKKQLGAINSPLNYLPTARLIEKWTNIETTLNTRMVQKAKQHWENITASYRINGEPISVPFLLSDAKLSSLRAAPRPTNGQCKCGSTECQFVNSPRCFLYSKLRELDDENPSEHDTNETSNAKSLAEDLNTVEKAFADRVLRQKKELESEEAEAIFVDRMERIQIQKCNQAVFAPSLAAIVLSAVVELGKKSQGVSFALNNYVFQFSSENRPSSDAVDPIEIDSDDEGADSVPLALINSKRAKRKSGEVNIRYEFLGKLIRLISEKWGHVYSEPSDLEFSWRWEVFHGENSLSGSKWDAGTRNPRKEGTLSLENIRFLLDEETLSGFQKVKDEAMYFKALQSLAFAVSPQQNAVCDELLALFHIGVLEMDDQRGIPVLSNDWYSLVDAMLLNDMDAHWSRNIDPVGKYGIIDDVRKLSDYWQRTDTGWLLKEEGEVVFFFNEIQEWRSVFETKHQAKSECIDGIGKFF